MDIFSILQLLSGLALFLYGMNTMGDGLEKFSGGKLEKTLEKRTFSAGFLQRMGEFLPIYVKK